MKPMLELKNDLTQGSLMVTKIPKDEIDFISLHTMVKMIPPFLVPFQHRVMNDEVELIYFLQSYTPLRYLKETKDTYQYVEFWTELLEPLLNCDDWFMDPFSFVLDSECIYLHKTTGKIAFFYIPTRSQCYDLSQLQVMLTNVSKIVASSDIMLENKVLKELQNFQLSQFLSMLKEYKQELPSPDSSLSKMNSVKKVAEDKSFITSQKSPNVFAEIPSIVAPKEVKNEVHDVFLDEISFEQPTATKKSSLWFGKKELKVSKEGKTSKKESKIPKETKKMKQLKDKKESGVESNPLQQARSVVMGGITSDFEQQNVRVSSSSAECLNFEDGATDVVEQFAQKGCPSLRKVGISPTPQVIPLSMVEGIPFIIGRFNVEIGTKQCDFEFDKSTKGVSRRHCAIEKRDDNFYIIDLGSKGGTIINGHQVDSSIASAIEDGDRISFGFSGVDYVFEL